MGVSLLHCNMKTKDIQEWTLSILNWKSGGGGGRKELHLFSIYKNYFQSGIRRLNFIKNSPTSEERAQSELFSLDPMIRRTTQQTKKLSFCLLVFSTEFYRVVGKMTISLIIKQLSQTIHPQLSLPSPLICYYSDESLTFLTFFLVYFGSWL